MSAVLKLVHENDKPDSLGAYYSDSEYPQGYHFEMVRIWELVEDRPAATPRFFRQVGTGDSYGEVTWSNEEMLEVKPTTKSVVVYDYTEI